MKIKSSDFETISKGMEFRVATINENRSFHWVLTGATWRSTIKTWKTLRGANKVAWELAEKLRNQGLKQWSNRRNTVRIAVVIVAESGDKVLLKVVETYGEHGLTRGQCYQRDPWEFRPGYDCEHDTAWDLV